MKGINYEMLRGYSSDKRNPIEVIQELGIHYVAAIHMRHYDDFYFFDCTHIPPNLPDCIGVFDMKEDMDMNLKFSKKYKINITAISGQKY